MKHIRRFNEEWVPTSEYGELFYNDSIIEIDKNRIILIRKANFSDESDNWVKMINWLSKGMPYSDQDMEISISRQCYIKEIIAPGIDKNNIEDISFLRRFGRIYTRRTTTGAASKSEGVCELMSPFRIKPI